MEEEAEGIYENPITLLVNFIYDWPITLAVGSLNRKVYLRDSFNNKL